MLDLTCTLQHQGAGRDGIAQWDTVRVFACRGGRAWATGGAVGICTCAVTHTGFLGGRLTTSDNLVCIITLSAALRSGMPLSNIVGCSIFTNDEYWIATSCIGYRLE